MVVALRSGVELASSESPAVFQLPAGDEALRLTVRANGYREAARQLDAESEEVEVALQRRTKVRRNHGPTIDDRNPLRH